MFCKYCGKEIDDDSMFCNKCGESQKAVKFDKDSKKGCLTVFIIFMIMIIGLLFFTETISLKNCNGNSTNTNKNDSNYDAPQLFTRDARINDVTITTETNYKNLGIDIIILPKVDIEDLEIKLIHYDKNGKELLTQYKTIGNVKEGVQVKTQVQLLDFSITDMFKVNNTKIEVVEGTVSYFD